MTLIDEYVAYLNNMDVAFAEEYIPYYLSSIGAHALNMANKKNKFHGQSGSLMDLRLHLMHVAPPGHTKSFFMDHMTSSEGLLDTGKDPNTMIAGRKIKEVTASKTVGTTTNSTDEDGEPEKDPGLLEKYKHRIFACDEFKSVIESSKSDHSSTLNSHLLSALEEGRVIKDMNGIEINYVTHATFWTAIQPMVMDLTSGMGRRFFYLATFPSQDQSETIREMRREGSGKLMNSQKMNRFRQRLNVKFHDKIMKIDTVKGLDKLYPLFDSWRDEMQLALYEEQTFERLAMGYSVFSHGGEDDDETVLEIELDDRLREMMKRAMKWRHQIKADPTGAQVEGLLRGERQQQMDKNELVRCLIDFGLDRQEAMQLIRRLDKTGVVKQSRDGTVELISEV